MEITAILRAKARGERNTVGDLWADYWCKEGADIIDKQQAEIDSNNYEINVLKEVIDELEMEIKDGAEIFIKQQAEIEDMNPRLVDFANGVKNNFCIARTRPDGFTEYWNVKQKKWCSAGTVIEVTE